jgi:hypothetical protein
MRMVLGVDVAPPGCAPDAYKLFVGNIPRAYSEPDLLPVSCAWRATSLFTLSGGSPALLWASLLRKASLQRLWPDRHRVGSY